MEKSNQELSAPDQLETLIQEKFSFTDFKKFMEEHRREFRRKNEKPEKETLRRLLIFVPLLCIVFGSLMLVIFKKPWVKTPKIGAERTSLPITTIEKEEEPRISGVFEEEGMDEKPLEGAILEEEKPSVSGPVETSTVTQESDIGKKMFILDENEAPKEGKEEEKSQVAMVEEPTGRLIPEAKLPTGGYTVNVGSFRKRVWAERLIKELGEKGYRAFIEETVIPKKGTWYRVAVGRFPSRRKAQAFARELKERDGINSFVRKLKEVRQ